jgi:hypothetical protein
MAVIGINYDGGNYYDDDGNLIERPIIYEGVTLRASGEDYEFNTGDFIKDWMSAKKKFVDLDDEPHFSQSSSVDSFFMDGAEYDAAYLHVENGVPVLKYVDKSDPNYLWTQREIYEDGWECFVPKGSKFTWEELKKYYHSV